MKKLIINLILICACVFAGSIFVNAQKVSARSKKEGSNAGVAILKGTGKVAVVVVGSAAKVAWGATKIVAKDIAKPVAKAVFLKAAPKLTIFMLKQSGALAKFALPWALRLSVL